MIHRIRLITADVYYFVHGNTQAQNHDDDSTITSSSERLPAAVPGPGRETGVTRQTLMRFARGESSMRLDLADKLAVYFGLKLTEEETDHG